MGQRQAHESTSDGIWEKAVTALKKYTEHGIWEEPGDELAEQLILENFGNPPNMEKLLAWLMTRPTGRRTISEMLSELASGKVPQKPTTPWET